MLILTFSVQVVLGNINYIHLDKIPDSGKNSDKFKRNNI
jgi:hypothetical protein